MCSHRRSLDRWAADYIAQNEMAAIESIQFFDSIAVVVKRRQTPRWHVVAPRPGLGA